MSPAGKDIAFERWLATTWFPALDGLRCLSIVPVVWHHATPRPLEGVLGRGPLGVDLFFVISGFLITTLLLRERRASGTVALGAFYVRRSLRIFPLYYVVLAAYVGHALVLRPHGPIRDHFLRSLPYYATYTANWLVDFDVPHPVVFAFAWSLAAEEQFYAFWPHVVRASRGLTLPALVMTALLALDQAAERGLLDGLVPAGGLLLRVLRSLSTPICAGSILAIALDGRRSFRVLAWLLGRVWSAPLAFAVLALAALLAWPLGVAHAAMVALVGACVLRADHGLRFATDAPAVRRIGVVSYGIYLLNVSIVAASRRALGPLAEHTVLVFALGLIGSLAAALVAHRFVERPFLRLRSRFRPSGVSTTP